MDRQFCSIAQTLCSDWQVAKIAKSGHLNILTWKTLRKFGQPENAVVAFLLVEDTRQSLPKSRENVSTTQHLCSEGCKLLLILAQILSDGIESPPLLG